MDRNGCCWVGHWKGATCLDDEERNGVRRVVDDRIDAIEDTGLGRGPRAVGRDTAGHYIQYTVLEHLAVWVFCDEPKVDVRGEREL